MSLFDASVDTNPHQIEAALFALRSPLLKGVMLADEVGLGKTIEAGILLCQLWAEHKRKLLVIVPASLRRQWSIELEEKFHLPSIILEDKSYKERKKKDKGKSPLLHDGIVIISYQFASRLKDELNKVQWDYVVIDEAHKLRNLYKADNKMGRNINEALADFKKVLLTATPLQNSLLELYGLASLIDDRIFGSVESFKASYINGTPNIEELKKRLEPFVHRTLRKQVLEYIKYTKREAITQPFKPSKAEQELYDGISDFILEHDTYAIPWAQRKLVVLIIRKLLASSAYAIIGTLKTIKARLEEMKRTGLEKPMNVRKVLIEVNDLDSEYAEDDEEVENPKPVKAKGKPVNIQKVEYEIQLIDKFIELARSIKVETKAKELLNGLDAGFKRMAQLGAPRKALIFTESSRTQRYLKEFLVENGYDGKILTFNGTNADDLSRSIYSKWLEKNKKTGRITGAPAVDMRMALVDYFRDDAEIMIATEAAAEGLNLQFCSLLVNYDLPWNPQRVEQRIGRCHRYGQKFDVVVINFLNKDNWADARIYELLREKFQLFDGVFGASDEVLGRIESGIDFEKRIYDIFDTCRTPEAIDAEFTKLRTELDEPIQERLAQTRQALFEHFDEDVHQRLKVRMESAENRIDEVTRYFWEVIKYYHHAQFEKHKREGKYLNQRPTFFNDEKLIYGDDEEFIRAGVRPSEHDKVPIYHYLDMRPRTEEEKKAEAEQVRLSLRKRKHTTPITGYPIRLSDVQGEMFIKAVKEYETPAAHLIFKLSDSKQHIGILDEIKGKSGWLFLRRLTVETFEKIDQLLFFVYDYNGATLKPEIGKKLFSLPAEINGAGFKPCPFMDEVDAGIRSNTEEYLKQLEMDNQGYFNEELDKLDHWATDLKNGLEIEIKKLDQEIRELDRQSKQMISLQEKLVFQKEKANLEKRRTKRRQDLFKSQDDIDQRRDTLIKQIEKQLAESKSSNEEIFRIQWSLQ